MNPTDYACINHRRFTSFAQQQAIEPDKNYLFDLSHLGIISCIGEQSAAFLQGQFSADVRQVDENTVRPALSCNLKGRILAIVDILQFQGMKLVLPKDLIDKTMSSLMKTALFSKVQLEASEHFAVYGFYRQNTEDLFPDNFTGVLQDYTLASKEQACLYHISHGLHIFITEKNKTEVIDHFKSKEQCRSGLTWHHLSLSKGFVSIYPESRGLFLPHRLELHKGLYIDFNKGCYKGQEIIARTHYKAKLKHCMKQFVVETQEPIYSGQKIFQQNSQQEVAEVIDYAPVSEKAYRIIVSILSTFDEPMVLFEKHSKLSLLNGEQL